MTMKSAFSAVSFGILVASALGQTGSTDSRLIHLDTPNVLAKDAFDWRIDVRAFRGDEELVYTSLSLNYGLGNGLEGILRGAFAPRRDFRAVRHGGGDVELAIKLRPQKDSPFAAMVGVSRPSTPAQSEAVFTAGLTASASNESVSGYLNPRAVFLKDNTLIGIGIGGSMLLSKNVRLIGDYTALVAGENTRDGTSGNRLRRPVYGIAVRFTTGMKNEIAIDLGFANGTGSTTGFALTPGLDRAGALYIALTSKH
jgi:hypothetical protein